MNVILQSLDLYRTVQYSTVSKSSGNSFVLFHYCNLDYCNLNLYYSSNSLISAS